MSADESMFFCAPEDGCPDGEPCPGHEKTKRRVSWDNLPEDVFQELIDPRFRHRQHHSRSTSRDGCRGPLCRKAERDDKMNRYARKMLAEGKLVKARSLEKRRPGDIWRNELLHEIFAWHMLERTRPEGTFDGAEARIRAAESQVGTLEQDGDSVRERPGVPGQETGGSDSSLRSVSA